MNGLRQSSQFAMLAFLLTSMASLGLSLSLGQILGPLSKMRVIALALVSNFVIVPLLAVVVGKFFRLDAAYATGLTLLALAPGAPFLPKITSLVDGDLALSVALMVLLMVGTVLYLPVVLPYFVSDATVGFWPIARPLLLLMLIPLALGLVVKGRFASIAERLRPGLAAASNVSLLLVIVLVIGLNLPTVLQVLGTGAIAATILFTVLAALTGYVFGGRLLATRKVMTLGTGFRNIAAALVVGEQSFKDPRVTVMLVIAALVAVCLLIPVVALWRKQL